MKRITSLLLVIAFAGVILLPVNVTVNNRSSESPQIADGGNPIPPVPPCVFNSPASVLQA